MKRAALILPLLALLAALVWWSTGPDTGADTLPVADASRSAASPAERVARGASASACRRSTGL